jgi:hypothetical protein
MSKERELLKRAMVEDDDGDWFIGHTLYKEIQELLAQPEQDQPVATKLETPQFQSFRVSFEDAKKLEALPVGTKIYTSPLYAAPPKREPLTPQQISVGNQSMLNVTREAFKDGVKWAEKEHGIGGGE